MQRWHAGIRSSDEAERSAAPQGAMANIAAVALPAPQSSIAGSRGAAVRPVGFHGLDPINLAALRGRHGWWDLRDERRGLEDRLDRQGACTKYT